jgi:Flp pilus assembly protein TadD
VNVARDLPARDMTTADFQYKLGEARQFLLAHEFARALAHYQKLTRAHPAEPVVWAEYGNAAAGAGQVELADQAWQKALGLARGNAELIGMIGMIGHQYQGMPQTRAA